MVREITVHELQELIDNHAPFTLIDVREPHEVDIATIGGKLIPLGTITEQVLAFEPEASTVVVYCRSGKRSATAIEQIQSLTGQTNLFNLQGGILAWADAIDNTLTKY
ncbi:rhodanese-like domain-containing protein [bacterium SCSIO 12741]|nr:rhodanese-like domain-containing protein [bacterium SCSIO 12741]